MTGRTSYSLQPMFIVHPPKANFEPLQKVRTSNLLGQKQARPRPKSGKIKLQTLPNPGTSTKTKLRVRTHPNLPKIPEPTNWVRPNTIFFWIQAP